MTPLELKQIAGVIIGAVMGIPLVLYLLHEIDSYLSRYERYRKWSGLPAEVDFEPLFPDSKLAGIAIFTGLMDIVVPITLIYLYLKYTGLPFSSLYV